MTAEEFKLARQSLGLSQQSLAEIMGMGADGARTIRRWENNERPPNPIACTVLRWLADGRVSPLDPS